MPKIVRTARGELIDFDAIVIKQQIAQAPMNIEVARRKEFIDSKEGRARGQRKSTFVSTDQPVDPNAFVTNEPVRASNESVAQQAARASDFEIEGADTAISSGPVEAVPNIPTRK